MHSIAVMRTLVRKEWRDVRAIACGALVLSLIAGVVFHACFGGAAAAQSLAEWLVAPMTIVFAMVLAAEIATGDADGRKLETLAGLPVRLGTLWSAKVVFLLLASIGFFAWAVVTQGLIAVAFGAEGVSARSVVPIAYTGFVMGLGATIVALTFAFATAFGRALPAVLLAIACPAGVVLAAREAVPRWELKVEVWHVVVGMTVVTGLFTLGAFLAFVGAPSFRRTRWSRVGLGVGVPFGVLAVTVGGSAFALEREFAFRPGEVEARIANVLPSPDGRHLALTVQRDGRLFEECLWAWIVDVESGEVRAIDRHHVQPWCWEPDGALLVGGTGPALGVRNSWLVDPVSLVEREEPPVPRRFDRNWARTKWYPDHAVVEWRDGSRGGTTTILGRVIDLSKAPALVLSQRDDKSVVVTDVTTGSVTVAQGAMSQDFVRFGPGGTSVICSESRSLRVLDARTGALIVAPFPGQPTSVDACGGSDRPLVLVDDIGKHTWHVIDCRDGTFVGRAIQGGWVQCAAGENDARFLFRHAFFGLRAEIVDLDGGMEGELDDGTLGVAVLAGGRIIAWTSERVDEIDGRGNVVRRMFPR